MWWRYRDGLPISNDSPFRSGRLSEKDALPVALAEIRMTTHIFYRPTSHCLARSEVGRESRPPVNEWKALSSACRA